MAPSVRTVVASSNWDPSSLTWPSLQQDDTVAVVVTKTAIDAASVSLSGFTEALYVPAISGQSERGFWIGFKPIVGNESGSVGTISGADGHSVLLILQGVDPNDPIDKVGTGEVAFVASPGTTVNPGLTTESDDALVIAAFSTGPAATGSVSGWTEHQDRNIASGEKIYSKVFPSAGATGSISFVLDSASAMWTAHAAVAFKALADEPEEQNVSPSGFQDTATFGTPMVTTVSTVSPTGVASTAALGTPSANHTIPAPGEPLEIRDFEPYNSNTSGTEHELAMPDHSEGDLLVAAFSPDGPGGQITLPDGWSIPQGLTDLINVDNVSSTVATKVATSSEPASYTFEIENTERAVGAILAISGHDGIEDAAQAWDSQAVIDNEALVPLPTVTTTVANCLILYLVTIDFGDDTDRTDPEGVARLLDIEQSSGAALWVGYEYLGVPGESPERILTLSAEEGWHAWTIAIKPAPGGSYTIVAYPQGIASTAAVGEPTVAPGAVTVTPDGIASTAAVGSPAVSGGNALSPSGIASTVAVGVPTLTPGPVSVSPTGLASGAAVGAPNVTPGGVTVKPEGIAPTTAIGLALAETVGLLTPIGLASTAALGTPTVVATYTLTPASIAPATDFGLLWFYTTVTVKVPEGLKANVRIGVIGAARKFRPTGLQVAVRELGLRRPVYRRRRRP